jgi:hypothetical protein
MTRRNPNVLTGRNLQVQYDKTNWPCLLINEGKSESIILYLLKFNIKAIYNSTVSLVFNTHGAALHRLMHAIRKKYF